MLRNTDNLYSKRLHARSSDTDFARIGRLNAHAEVSRQNQTLALAEARRHGLRVDAQGRLDEIEVNEKLIACGLTPEKRIALKSLWASCNMLD